MPSCCLAAGSRRGSGFSDFRCLDAAILDAAAQLVDGQAGARLARGNGVEIGPVGVLVRKDGPAGIFQSLRFVPPLRPTGDLGQVHAPAFGSALEGLAGLHVALCGRKVVVNGAAGGGPLRW